MLCSLALPCLPASPLPHICIELGVVVEMVDGLDDRRGGSTDSLCAALSTAPARNASGTGHWRGR